MHASGLPLTTSELLPNVSIGSWLQAEYLNTSSCAAQDGSTAHAVTDEHATLHFLPTITMSLPLFQPQAPQNKLRRLVELSGTLAKQSVLELRQDLHLACRAKSFESGAIKSMVPHPFAVAAHTLQHEQKHECQQQLQWWEYQLDSSTSTVAPAVGASPYQLHPPVSVI